MLTPVLWPESAQQPCVGLGLRRELLDDLQSSGCAEIDFLEIAPENWMAMGGRWARLIRAFSERYPLICHGLSLDLGGMRPLDVGLLRQIRTFMHEHNVGLYTEHLSWCGDDGHLYDLLPMPLTGEAVRWMAQRIRQAQDILGQRIGVENPSYYAAPPGAEMSEAEFIHAVVTEADCWLHLDVNNVYVNSRNFGFDAHAFLQTLPLERVCYIHVAGHHVEADGLHIDTHGAAVIDPVWSLLDAAYRRSGIVPTCLERDTGIPPLAELLPELAHIRAQQCDQLALQRAVA